MTKSQLKNIISATVKTNGVESITGENLQETLNTIVDNVPTYEDVVSGINLGFLTPSSPAAPATGIHRGQASEAGTYTNFKDAANASIVVTDDDLDIVNGAANYRVIIEVKDGVASKYRERVKGDTGSVPLVGTTGASTTSAMSQKAVTDEINGIYNGVTELIPDTSVPFNLTSYYRAATGAVNPTAYGHNRTDKFLLKKGDKLKYGVNTYTITGGSGLVNFYNLDGTFKENYLTTNTDNINSFVQGEYIATEDVMVGMSNYNDGNYGTAYATIVHVAPPNLNKGLTFLLENAEDVEEQFTEIEERVTELEVQDVNSVAKEVENIEMYERGQATLNLSATKKIGILVAGQSNTEGRVPIAQAPAYITGNDNTVPNVQMWNNGTKVFAPFKFGVNTGSGTGNTTASLYAYDAVASYLLATEKAQTIYLIKRAKGGTAIDTSGVDGGGWWTPKTEGITSGSKLIEELKIRVKTALAADPTLEIKAVMWHQGESDTTTTAAPLYYQNLKNVIAYIRGIVGNPKLPFVFGTIATVSSQYNATVDAAMRQIDTEDPFVYLVDMSAGTLLDPYHFDATSTNALGTAMFDILKNLV